MFTSTLGEIAGDGIHQSESKKGPGVSLVAFPEKTV